MAPEAIIAAARSLLDVPFRHQGRNPAIGIDCVGLVAVVANTMGLPIIDRTDYARTPGRGALEAALDMQPSLIRVASPQTGDVLVMRFVKSLQHVGIFTGDTLIHADSVVGKVCEHRLDGRWHDRIVRVYRFVGVEQ